MAANELNDFSGFVVNAGGDLFAGGVDENGGPWKIGIQHPENKDQVISVLEVSNQAVCTKGRQREQADIERAKEIARLIGPLQKHIKTFKKQWQQVKKVFSGCAEIGGNWQTRLAQNYLGFNWPLLMGSISIISLVNLLRLLLALP